MTKAEFVEFLEELGAPYEEVEINGLEQVYVYSRREYELKRKYPRKYKDLYLPYLRVSNFGGELYTRENGWCEYMPDSIVLEKCKELGA